MNPAPISRLKDQPTIALPAPSTPASTRDAPSPATPSHLSRASPKPRRPLGEKGTPRASRLGQEVFSASAGDGEQEDDGKMDVDEDK